MDLDGDAVRKWEYYDVNTAPRIFDIVLCRFPFVETPDIPPDKHRAPCLVRAVRLHRSRRAAYVKVVVGTTNIKWDRRYDDLQIQNAADLHAMGLDKATRFDLDREFDLPWAKEWFPIPYRRMTPKIGALTQEYIEMLRDLAVDRQERLKARKA